ncbi:MAG: lipid-A-disaccharide synthase [Pedosphaera sp.]|nr:lipid-A-disaccharide synthase [Pedosphaera sp.]MST01108.1 lipid-A-disaccharide synthase [Pedosphaera sp.]
MNPRSVMLIAGEASGDLLAAELVAALRVECGPHVPQFFGAGGPKMAAAGVGLAFDLTQHSVIGLWEALRKYGQFKRLFDQLVRLACERQPDVIVCVDFSGFNRRFAAAIRAEVRRRRGVFHNWEPKIVQYVSPQVWASRPGRAYQMARDYDLLLSILPFEKAWYAARVPELRVEFVGHPIVERHAGVTALKLEGQGSELLLLPGSRVSELRRHLPPMLAALERIRTARPEVRARMVLPNEEMAQLARGIGGAALDSLTLQIGGLSQALTTATAAIASTGTVTLECALFGVPTVAMYRTSWPTYLIGRQIVQVKYLAMPNLLADEPIYPEFIQSTATPENLANATLEFLDKGECRDAVKAKLARALESLGETGASCRAARAILALS